MADIVLEDVWKVYGDGTEAVRSLDLDIADGEFMVLVGPSGCGKTTALRMVAGLEAISKGTLRIGDRVVNDMPPKDRDIAMVFQNYALYPHMSVYDNMAFGLKLQKVPRDEIDTRVREASRILGLQELLDRKPKALSGGQRQRVAMGRAIVRDPEVFLFDEPLSNLDAKLRVAMRAEIKELHQRLQTTTVYVTHDQIEAMTMADKIVVMRDGIVEQVGSPLGLYDKPQNIFVAGFIGSPAMNFVKGKLKVNGSASFESDGGFILPVADAPANANGKPMICGVRPEHLMIDPAGIPAEVVVIEPTGSETQVIARHGGQDITCLFRERITARPGETIPIIANPKLVHLFDPDTGARV